MQIKHFTTYKSIEIALKYTNMTKSKKTSKTRQIFDLKMEPKTTTLLPICFKITAMHSIYCWSLPIWRRSPLEKGPLIDLFLPSPGSAPARGLPKSLNTGAGPWVLYPYQVSSRSIVKADYVFPYIYMH